MMGRLAAVFQIPGLTVQQRCVLGVLADCENPKDGKCCPKMDTIAKRLGLKLRQVNNIIRELRNIGLIYSHSNGRSNTYTFRFDTIKESNKDDEDDRCATDCISDMQPIAYLGCATDCISDMQPIAHRNSKRNGKVKSVNESSPPTVSYGSQTVAAPPPHEVCRDSGAAGLAGMNQTAQHGANHRSTAVTTPTTATAKPHSKFRKGLEWLDAFEPFTNPYDALLDKTGCDFLPAWDPADPDTIIGCTLPKDDIERIKANPIGYALEVTGEAGSRIARKAFQNRLEWIGLDHFACEVARMYSEQRDGKSNCKNAGQILMRRMEYVYAAIVATGNHTHTFDVQKLWDYAKAV